MFLLLSSNITLICRSSTKLNKNTLKHQKILIPLGISENILCRVLAEQFLSILYFFSVFLLFKDDTMMGHCSISLNIIISCMIIFCLFFLNGVWFGLSKIP